jgi:hypothetical protein
LIEVADRIWRTPDKAYIRPLPQRLSVTARGKSRRLERVLTDFGSEYSFARATASLREHYGVTLGASAVRNCTLEHAQRAEEKLQEQYAAPFRLLPSQGPAHVIAQADGTMICTVAPGLRKGKRPREWKEIKLVAAQAKGSTETIYGATFSSVEKTGRRWGHCALQAGWSSNSRIHSVGDGAEWIRLQAHEVFGAQGTYLCDFYHVSEYLAAAAQTCRKDQPNQWRRTQQKRLRRGALELVIQALVEKLEPVCAPDEEAPVRNAHRYLSNRMDCLNYSEALRLDLPIGSGMIESGRRHVLHARLKKAGTAWLQANADSLAQLRVLRANGNWEALWN